MGIERRDLGARAARERLAALIDVDERLLGRISEEQALAMADELRSARERALPPLLTLRRRDA